MFFDLICYCVVPENIHTPPTEGIGNSREEGEFPEGWGGHRANSFRGRVWMFSGTTHYFSRNISVMECFNMVFCVKISNEK